MKILRRVFVPLLVFFFVFTALFVGLLLRERYNIRQQLVRQEAVTLARDLRVHLDFLETAARAIAVDWAHNPDFARALAEGDRDRLFMLTEPIYRALRDDLNIQQMQFHKPPAISFLRLHAPEHYGDDLSQLRPMVVAANSNLETIVGLEVGRAGLGLRAVTPVFYQQRHVGSLEVGIGLGEDFLSALKEASNADWTLWLLPQYAAEVELIPSVQAAGDEGRLAELSSTIPHPLPPDAETCRRILDGENRVVAHRRIGERQYVVYTFPLYDYAHRLVGMTEVFYDESAILREQQQYLGLYLFLFTLAFILAGSGIYLLLERSLRPIKELDTAVMAITAGEMDRPVAVQAKDELGELAEGIERMRRHLYELLQQMGRRIEERTAELRRRSQLLLSVAHLSRLAASIREPAELLETMVARMTEAFGFYHVAIFLRDARGEYMVLQAASSEGGKKMLEAGHRLRIGETGIVGYVAYTGNPRVAQATEEDEVFFNNPYLPETRAEMALPLRIEDEIIGVLDVQATETGAFEETDVSIFQTLADQLALALHNARLLQEADERLSEVNRLLITRSVENWRELLQTRWSLRYLYDGVTVRPLSGEIEAGTMPEDETEAVIIDVPLEPRSGEIIGRLRLGWPTTPRPAEMEIVRAVAGEVAAALESARLFTESQNMLVEAELLYRVQRAIAAAQSPEEIVRIFAEDLFNGMMDRLILLQDQGRDTGFFLAFWGRDEDDPMRSRLGYEVALPQAVARSTDPFFSDDLEAPSLLSEEDKAIFRKAGVRSIAVIPLVAGNDRWGWMVVGMVRQTYTFLERERRLLRILSESAAVALQNILLVEHAQRRVRREQQARELADMMQASADVEMMLRRVARELRSALGAGYVSIRLGDETTTQTSRRSPKPEEEQ